MPSYGCHNEFDYVTMGALNNGIIMTMCRWLGQQNRPSRHTASPNFLNFCCVLTYDSFEPLTPNFYTFDVIRKHLKFILQRYLLSYPLMNGYTIYVHGTLGRHKAWRIGI